MDIKTSEVNSSKIFHIVGEIRGPQIVELCKKLENLKSDTCHRAVIDLSRVEYIDSSGLGGLIYSRNLLKKNNIELCLASPQGYLQKLFRDCSFEKVFPILESY